MPLRFNIWSPCGDIVLAATKSLGTYGRSTQGTGRCLVFAAHASLDLHRQQIRRCFDSLCAINASTNAWGSRRNPGSFVIALSVAFYSWGRLAGATELLYPYASQTNSIYSQLSRPALAIYPSGFLYRIQHKHACSVSTTTGYCRVGAPRRNGATDRMQQRHNVEQHVPSELPEDGDSVVLALLSSY